jgi:hypothetical protein
MCLFACGDVIDAAFEKLAFKDGLCRGHQDHDDGFIVLTAEKFTKIKDMGFDGFKLDQQKIVFMLTYFLFCTGYGGCLMQVNPEGLKMTVQAVSPGTVAADI